MPAPHRSAMKLEKNDEYDIKKSMEKIGPLYPVLKDTEGKIIDGIHRKQADKNWPEHIVSVSGYMTAVARIVANVQRREVTPEEKSDMLKELAEATNWTSEQIAESTGMSISWVRKYLPSEFKNQDMAKLANKKHEKKPKIDQEAREEPKNGPRKQTSSSVGCPNCRSAMVPLRVCLECGEMVKPS